MNSLIFKTAVCSGLIALTPTMAIAQTGKEPIFHWVKQAPQDFDHFMRTKRNLGYGAQTPRGENLLHIGARCEDSFSNVTTLIRNGVDPNQVDKLGKTPLMNAANSYCHDSVLKLINNGADPKATDVYGNSAIHYWAIKGNIKHLRFIAGAGGDINAQDVYGRSALHLAVQTLNTKAVEALINSQANLSLKDEFGVTALSLIDSMSDEKMKKRDKKKRDKIIKYLQTANAGAGDAWDSGNYTEKWAKEKIAPKAAELKEKTAKVEQAKVQNNTQSQRIVIRPSAAPTTVSDTDLGTCENPNFINLTPDQGAALVYVINEEKSDGFCIEKITAIKKFPLRGNTVIEFKAVVFYSKGRNAHCLRAPKDQWERRFQQTDTSCISNLSGKALAPGSRAHYNGKIEI